MLNDKYKMVQDLADGWREKYEDAKQQLAKAHRLIDELETKRDIAVSTLEKVKADRATAQKALAAQCEETKKLTEAYEAGKRDAIPEGLLESVAKAIYAQWRDNPKYVAWVEGGNSIRQDSARSIAKSAIEAAAPKGEE